MVEANPTSGYDDSIYVVMETIQEYAESTTRPVCAYRTQDRAEDVADERSGPFKNTFVRCIGLTHE